MGRQEPSQGLAPPPVRKQQRAKHAKLTVNKTIPALLAADARARKGVEQAVLIRDPAASSASETVSSSRPKAEGRKLYVRKDSQVKVETVATSNVKDVKALPNVETSGSQSLGQNIARPDISIRCTDSLTAAYEMQINFGRGSRNIGLLNMASALRPGGGVLQGATSQEEFLCTRTTLLPSLKDEYYRLPDVGGIFTRDVLVFRLPDRESSVADSGTADGDRELGRTERFYVDVFSASMLRTPELVDEDGEVSLANQKDAELVLRKMEAVRDIFLQQGIRKVILGAWGCGAYGNPVSVIARSWKKVLLDPISSKDGKSKALTEVIFAVKEHKMAHAFAAAWGDDIAISADDADDAVDEEDIEERNNRELDERIEQMRAQLEATKFPMMRDRLTSVLDGLIRQRQCTTAAEAEESE